MINPFSVKSMARQLAQASIVKISKLDIEELPNANAEQKELESNQELFLALREPLAKKINGERRSVILTKTDVHEFLSAAENGVRGTALMAWSFIPIPLSILLFPLVEDLEPKSLATIIALGPTGAIAGVLQLMSYVAFWRGRREIKRLAKDYWTRGLVVRVPKHLNQAYFKTQLRVMSGPVAAYVLDEAVDIVPNEQAQLAFETLVLGHELVKPLK